MNKELAKRITENFRNISLNDTEMIDGTISCLKKEHGIWDLVSDTKLKIFVACMKFNENELKANELLMGLIPEAPAEDLIMIFKKISIYSDEFIEYCKKYSRLKKLRPTITGIFAKLGIIYERAHIYPANVQISDENTIAFLLKTLNTSEFKHTKPAIASLDLKKNSHLLPKLNESGIRNFRSVCAANFSKFFVLTPYHQSETARVEYFKVIQNMSQITKFLMINQFLDEDTNRVEIAELFRTKLCDLKTEANFQEFINSLCDNLFCPMCKSQNLARRRLGSLLLLNSLDFLDRASLPKETINGLVYDKNHMIRKSASKYCKMIDKNILDLIADLKTTKSHKIIGACEFLKDHDPAEIFAYFKSEIKDKKTSVLGFLYYFNLVNFCPEEYSEIIDKIFAESSFEDSTGTNDWRVLREILVFYYQSGKIDIPINILLRTDHLGMICFLKDMIDLTKISGHDLKKYISLGLIQIRKKENIIRKSGGLSEYFALLVKNRRNYLSVKEALFDIICESLPSIKIKKDLPEPLIVHVLNAFIAILNECCHDDLEFYVKLGFECFNSVLFSIKNCGCSIISSIFKKQLSTHKDFDPLFLSYHRIRLYVSEMLEYSISVHNLLSVQFILFILSRTSSLTDREIQLIEKCSDFGGFVGLKSGRILKNEPRKSEGAKLILKFNDNVEEKNILLRVLLIYNTNDVITKDAAKRYLEKYYNFPVVSYEYSVHLLMGLIKEKGHSPFFKEKLAEIDFNSTGPSLKSENFDECPCNEDGDTPYLMSLL